MDAASVVTHIFFLVISVFWVGDTMQREFHELQVATTKILKQSSECGNMQGKMLSDLAPSVTVHA